MRLPKSEVALIGLCLGAVFLFVAACGEVAAEQKENETSGAIHLEAFDLPLSAYLSDEARKIILKNETPEKKNEWLSYAEARAEKCGSVDTAAIEELPMVRQCLAEFFYDSASYQDLRSRYDVLVGHEVLAGVYVETFLPGGGISEENRNRILINVHGSGFKYLSRVNSHIESIPIASVGKIKVISVDYRMAPEFKFPAASDDVAAVYKALLTDYAPENIGIFGCSAGGRITGQAVAKLIEDGTPLPGAIAILCSPPTRLDGDSNHIVWAMAGREPLTIDDVEYFDGVNPHDPLAFPGESPEMLAHFPPSLLITGGRDYSLSPMIKMHSVLVRLGVETDLHIWEGLGHGFMGNPALPESREVYDVVTKFFDKHLGSTPRGKSE